MPEHNRGYCFKVVTALTAMVIASLALVGLFQAGRSKGQAEGEYNANSDTYARDAQEDIEQRCILLDPLRMAECISKIVDTHNESETAQRDLLAQTDMALWAFAMTVLTAITTLVTGSGVWYVRKTLTQANDTNKAAVAASIAANDANVIARKEQRPWLHVELGEISEFAFRPDTLEADEINRLWMKVPCKITNVGKTPAMNVTIAVEALNLPDAYAAVAACSIQAMPSRVGAIAPSATIASECQALRHLAVPPVGPHDSFIVFLVVLTRYWYAGPEGEVAAQTIQQFSIRRSHDEGSDGFLSYRAMARGGIVLVGEAWGGEMT